MKKILKLTVLFIFTMFIFACGSKKEKLNNFLLGPLTIENKDGTYLLYDQNKLATGILKGKDLILGLNYDMYYLNGQPTGKVIYFNETQKMIEVDMNFDYSKDSATGSIKIFNYNGNDVAILGMQYLNIVSKPENFVELKNARPSLKWYLENPANIFTEVEIFNDNKKISSIKDNRYFFYDEEGQTYEIPLVRDEISSTDDFLIYAEEDEKILIDEKDTNISYDSTDKSIDKIKIGTIYASGAFKVVDDNDNSFILDYYLGVPTGNFEINSPENSNFNIIAKGKYEINNDSWQGDINIYSNGEDKVELKNTKILGKDLFKERNIINYSWISINPNRNEPLDLNNISSILAADVYFNDELVGKINKGIYSKENF